MAKKTPQSENIDFEKTLEELETLVQRLEQGEQSLELSLKDFEKGVQLTRAAQQALKDAEQKVQMLTGEGEDAKLAPFEGEAE